MNVIIWSKNRASQLDLLLRSIQKYWIGYENNQFNIIYKYDNDEYKKGYDKVLHEYDLSDFSINFIEENNFKECLLLSLDDSPLTMLLCDDDIFTRGYIQDDTIMHDPNILCISLRLGYNITSHYIKGECKVPERINGKWDWQGKDIDWGYPMSVGSGHIFRTADLKPIFNNNNYTSPTDLEDCMNANKISRSKMFCYDESIVMNIVLNRVQTIRDTLCGYTTAEEINDKLIEGRRIRLEPFHNYRNSACHIITDIEYD